MNGICITALLLSASVLFCSSASPVENQDTLNHELMERAGNFFGIPIPDFITNIPIFGQLIQNSAQLVNNSTANVFAPALNLISVLTSGYLNSSNPIFQLLDRSSGGMLSALSGTGGIKPPVLDGQDVINVGKKFTGDAGSLINTFAGPLLSLLNIPGDAIGGFLKQIANAVGGFPTLTLVTPAPVVTQG